jgi:fatty-acyl-CoA synthase
MLLNCPELGRYDTSSLQNIMIGGAASSPELVERMERAFHCPCERDTASPKPVPWPRFAPANPPSPTPMRADRMRRQAMTGWPMPGCEVRVVDLHMNDVPRDMQAIGEIVIRGDMVMDGYYKEPQATAAVMTGGWLHTGDMAVWDEESYIHIVDRKKDIIISGGENISSIEVERAIAAHPAVLECAVVSAPDPCGAKCRPPGWCVKPGQPLEEASSASFCRRSPGQIQNAAPPAFFE